MTIEYKFTSQEDILAFRGHLKLLKTHAQMQQIIQSLAQEMSLVLADCNPIMLSVLHGSLIFAGQLLVHLQFPLQQDYMQVKSYHGKTHSHDFQWVALPSFSLAGRTVVILEDILDSGTTLAKVRQYCIEQGAKKVYTVAMLDKQVARAPDGLKSADFVGITIPNLFVVGYGLDYQQYWRNLDGVYYLPD